MMTATRRVGRPTSSFSHLFTTGKKEEEEEEEALSRYASE